MAPWDLDIPETLETARLILRRPVPGDGAVVNAALRDSWKELGQWMHWAVGDPPPVEETEANNLKQIKDWNERTGLHFNLYLKADGAFIGKCSLFAFDWEVPKGEIGYWQRTPYAGQGYMTEAVQAVQNLALVTLGFVRVEIRCDRHNQRSAAVAERSGYIKEACLHNESRTPQGELRDTLIFAKFPDASR